MLEELVSELKKPNVVVIDTLPKAQLMNKLQLAKIVGLTIILLLLLKLADCPTWEMVLVPVAIAGFTVRGFIRDSRRQRQVFANAENR